MISLILKTAENSRNGFEENVTSMNECANCCQENERERKRERETETERETERQRDRETERQSSITNR